VLAINGLKDGSPHWSTTNSSVLYAGTQPSAKDAMNTYTKSLHCTTAWKTTVDRVTNITHMVAPCTAPNSLEEQLVPALGHTWTSKPSDWSTNGINATVTTWSFLKRYWT